MKPGSEIQLIHELFSVSVLQPGGLNIVWLISVKLGERGEVNQLLSVTPDRKKQRTCGLLMNQGHQISKRRVSFVLWLLSNKQCQRLLVSTAILLCSQFYRLGFWESLLWEAFLHSPKGSLGRLGSCGPTSKMSFSLTLTAPWSLFLSIWLLIPQKLSKLPRIIISVVPKESNFSYGS